MLYISVIQRQQTFSPLFIGASVATKEGQEPRRSTQTFQSPFHRGIGCYQRTNLVREISERAFSPLFIGASVATVPSHPQSTYLKYLSVPFSSGHRLLLDEVHLLGVDGRFQSPFHRGIGCYSAIRSGSKTTGIFQSPFHRGIGCYSAIRSGSKTTGIFQSPFHRGIGCYGFEAVVLIDGLIFQSPFHRGIGCYSL